MGAFSSWLDGNWFNLVQTVGVIGSLCMTAEAARREAKAREVENLLTIADHNRQLWSGVRQRKELKRIFQCEKVGHIVDATVDEEEFLNLVINHFQTTWCIAKIGGIITPKELADDAGSFFSLPVPHAVWERTKVDRNKEFVRFVERAIDAAGRF